MKVREDGYEHLFEDDPFEHGFGKQKGEEQKQPNSRQEGKKHGKATTTKRTKAEIVTPKAATPCKEKEREGGATRRNREKKEEEEPKGNPRNNDKEEPKRGKKHLMAGTNTTQGRKANLKSTKPNVEIRRKRKKKMPRNARNTCDMEYWWKKLSMAKIMV